jgi:hypothetical protein
MDLVEINRDAGDVIVRPLDDADVHFAYQLAAELEAEWPRIYSYGPLASHTFGEMLWRDVLAIFAVRAGGSPVGVTGLYDVDYRHGVGWVEVVLAGSGSHGADLRLSVAEHVTGLAFGRFGLRKVFCWHAGCQEPPLGSLGIEEARLENCVLHDGWYWDRVVTSVTSPAARHDRIA